MSNPTIEAEFHLFLARRDAADARLHEAGDAGPLKALFARRDDVTLLGAAGGATTGWAAAGERLDWVARQGRGERTTSEYLAVGVTAEMAYTVAIQRGEQLFAGSDTPPQSELRVTEIYRRETGEWRLVHRHADPLVALQRGP